MEPLDDLLNMAPCGFLSTTDSGIILVANITLLKMIGHELTSVQGRHIETLLPIIGRLLYHTHLVPLLVMHGKVEEAVLSLQFQRGGTLPVLVNAVRRERREKIVHDWVFMPMHLRTQYEDQILRAKKAADEATRLQIQANAALVEARAALEIKQAELVEANARLEALATLDALTGLKNRRVFQEQLDFQFALATRTASPISVLILDVDHFKRINDTFGHPTGDRYLQMLASILQQNSRDVDIVARYGGEEFAIILLNTNQIDAIGVAEKLRRAVEAESWPNTAVTISIGVSTLSQDIRDQSHLLSSADRALYLSKERGRNRVTHARDVKHDGLR